MNRYRDWLDQADIQYQYWEWACFTAQQAAEKAVKALLMNRGASTWGHAITPMVRNMPEIAAPADLVEWAQLLDAYYIPTRYPNGFAEGKSVDYFNEPKAREAVHAAGEIIRFCKDHLERQG